MTIKVPGCGFPDNERGPLVSPAGGRSHHDSHNCCSSGVNSAVSAAALRTRGVCREVQETSVSRFTAEYMEVGGQRPRRDPLDTV